ncbi:hypothetical protein [Vibrio algicola]|uniref:Uncharacterized protein n=1 Tax=Vibrio algicola TaxID=2662262 RepID=A0A5Q0TFN6_9VIBR|nr:hypothetical protein [Vibrio algicola]
MKKTLLALTLLFSTSTFAAAQFINPMDFDGSQTQKDQVVEYIKDRVHKDYCEGPIDMCQESMLRMMEKKNLADFKAATKVTDRKIMDKVIKDYCGNSMLDMCTYTNILMMYKQNEKASKQSLEW